MPIFRAEIRWSKKRIVRFMAMAMSNNYILIEINIAKEMYTFYDI